MNILLSLSKNTFREAIRDRIMYTIAFFGFLFLLAAPLAGELAAGQEDRIVTNFGITMIHIFGLFITIFVGSRLIFNEIDKKTIYLLIPKPVPRSHVVLGKFFGLGAVLFCIIALMSLVFFFLVPFEMSIMLILVYMYVSYLLLLALVLFFSAFMSPLIASVSAILMFLIGSSSYQFKHLAGHIGGETLQKVADVVYYVIPNFSGLNLKIHILYGIPHTTVDLLLILLSAIVFIMLFLFLATAIFSRKEFG